MELEIERLQVQLMLRQSQGKTNEIDNQRLKRELLYLRKENCKLQNDMFSLQRFSISSSQDLEEVPIV